VKGTAIALLIVSGYWFGQGLRLIGEDTIKGVGIVLLGVLIIPLAWYLWGRKLR
jgi:hypothetical protein